MSVRKQFTPEFKREAVQLVESGSRSASELARELGVRRNQLYKWQREFQARGTGAFPGSGTRKERMTEITRLKRELARVTEERDILKKAAVGSGDQRNTIWGTVELEGDRHGTYGASGLVYGPESGPVAAMATGAIVERDRPGTRQARGIDS